MTETLSQNGNYNAHINRFSKSSRTKEQWLIEGINFYNATNYEEALKACEKALQLDPQYAQAYYGKGLTLSKLNYFEEALAAYEQAIQLKTDYARAYNGKASILSKRGLLEESLMAFDRAIEIEPKNANAFFGKGEAFYRLKRYSEALNAYEKALLLDHNLENIDKGRSQELLEEASNLFQSQQINEAHTVYQIAVLIDSNPSEDYRVHSKALFNEGKRLFELKHYEKALDAFEIAIMLQRRTLRTSGSGYVELADKLIYKGEILFQLQRFQEIHDVYEEVRSAYKQNPSLYNAKSSALIKKAREFYRVRFYVKSYAAYKRAILFNPKPEYIDEYKIKSEDLLLRSLDFYERGRYEKALLMYNEAIQFNPDSLKKTFVQARDISEVKQFWQSEKHRLNNSQTSDIGGELHKDEESIDYEQTGAREYSIIKTTRDFEGVYAELWHYYLQ